MDSRTLYWNVLSFSYIVIIGIISSDVLAILSEL